MTAHHRGDDHAPVLDTELLRLVAPDAIAVRARHHATSDDIAEVADPPESVAPGRRLSFVLGRLAARDVLADLGAPPGPIHMDERRRPIWPKGVVGSISHSGGVGIAVAAWSDQFFGVGIDVEKENRAMSESAIRRISTPAEESWLETTADRRLHALVLFCAKEALYKAVSRSMTRTVRFRDVEFAAPKRGSVATRRAVPGVPPEMGTRLIARYIVARGFVVACVSIPRQDGAERLPQTG